MSLNSIKSKLQNDRGGFTIIELLIVIVVIGILAAITIVSYTGITTQANVNSTKANAAALMDAVNAAYANTGTYPAFSAGGFTTAPGTTGVTIKSPAGLTLTANGLGTANASTTTIIYVVMAGNAGACIGWAYGASNSGIMYTGSAGTMNSPTGTTSTAATCAA